MERYLNVQLVRKSAVVIVSKNNEFLDVGMCGGYCNIDHLAHNSL